MSNPNNKTAQKTSTSSSSTTTNKSPEQMNMSFSQTNSWTNVESLNNGHLLLSPPHNNSHMQRENMQVTQPSSIPSSPLTSPGAQSSTSFTLPNTMFTIDTGDPNWQATKPTVRERNAAMFNNELMSDISFIVGSDDNVQTIHSHKYVLATGSSVFYAMFYGGLAENKKEIKVPDVEPSAFLTLLKYLYCDEIYLEADNVLATLYAAKKYIVPHLARACVNYLETSLTAKNACLLLSQSRLFEEPELMQRCWEVIDAQVCDRLDNLNVSQCCTKNDANAVSTRIDLSPINDTNRNHSYNNHIYINNTSIYNNNNEP